MFLYIFFVISMGRYTGVVDDRTGFANILLVLLHLSVIIRPWSYGTGSQRVAFSFTDN